MSSSNAFASLALLAISSAPALFASGFMTTQSYHSTYQVSSTSTTGLNYRSLHHGPDIQPLTDIDKMGASVTRMDKDKINNYGPGDFNEYVDHERSDLFDGGDSEMGIFGDGNNGLQKFGCDVTPHMTRTLAAKSDEGTLPTSTMSYTDELLLENPGMDTVRAQQLKNWANQREISISNNYSYMNQQYQEEQYMPEYAYDIYEDEPSFAYAVQAGDVIEKGTIVLSAPVNSGVATHELLVKNPYMGFAKFRAAFVGDDNNEWSVTPNDGFLKSSEETQFIVRYTPHSSGTSRAFFVIETEDFTKTWKVVGSTGEYDF